MQEIKFEVKVGWTCEIIDKVCLERSMPASKNASAGHMPKTSTVETKIQVVSPASTAHSKCVDVTASGAIACTTENSPSRQQARFTFRKCLF